jgi:hypothetical protein
MDMYGSALTLNFNKKGTVVSDKHNTFIGGFFSFFVRLILLAYTVLIFKRMIGKEQNLNITEVDINDLETLGAINYNETSNLIFHVMRHQITGK